MKVRRKRKMQILISLFSWMNIHSNIQQNLIRILNNFFKAFKLCFEISNMFHVENIDNNNQQQVIHKTDDKYNMSELRVTKKQFSLKRTHDLRFSGDELQQLQCRFAESQLKSCTMSDLDESEVFDKQSINYQQIQKSIEFKYNPLRTKPLVHNNSQKKKQTKLSFGQCIQLAIGTNNDKKNADEQQNQHKDKIDEYKISLNKKELKVFPQYFIVNEVQPIAQIELGKNNNENEHKIKQNLKPIEITLPAPQYQIKPPQIIIPCTNNAHQSSSTIQKFSPIYRRKQTQESKDEQLKNQFLFVESHAMSHHIDAQQIEKNKQVTNILLQKICDLQNKVKQLQEEKAKNLQMQKTVSKNNYQSTPNQHQSQSVVKGKQFTKTTQSEEGSEKVAQNFRVKITSNRNMTNSEYKIHSNLYSMAISEPISDGNSIKQQIKLLKIKLSALQNTHVFNNPSIRESISDNNQKVFRFIESKIFTQNRKQFEGKIIKRFSKNGTPTPQNSKMEKSEAENQFIRSRPQNFINESNTQDNTKFSKNKESSSAIFRKNPGPANQRKQNQPSYNIAKTIQFNPSHQKITFNESKQYSSIAMVKNQSFFTMQSKQYPQIHIPQLFLLPNPNCSSQQLVEIGKVAFTKLGCQVTQSTVLNVKKYKNCVLFSISPQENILWHYQGRFYFGGWKTQGNGQGQKYGKGIEFCPGKYKYKGSFKDSKRQGYGQMILQNGLAYMGEWHQGQKNGEGKQIQDGRIYQGGFKMGKKWGHGKIFNNGQLEFEGKFEAGEKNGYGQEHFQNGDYYQGQYLDNKFEGQGRYVWNSKAEYNGQFKQGKRHGHGIWKSSNINFDTFEGEYAEDNKNGYGIYTWANGAVYKGPFKDDLKHGEGIITYENGHTVNLVWKNGHAVQKSLQMSQTSQKGFELANRKRSSTTSHPRKEIEKTPNQLRASTRTLVSSAQKQLSKAIVYKKDEPTEAKLHLRNRANSMTRLRNPHELNQRPNRHGNSSSIPQDPPYRGMQTTTNINMHL